MLLSIAAIRLRAQDSPEIRHIRFEINSNPSGATVYLDSTVVGLTPLIIDTVTDRSPELRLIHKDCEPWSLSAIPQLGTVLKVNASLVRKFARMEIRSLEGDITVFVDSIQVGEGPIVQTNVAGGSHMIEVRQSNASRVARSRITVRPEESIRATARMDHFTFRYVAYSAVVPGLGQFADEGKLEGISFFLAGLASAYAALTWHNEYSRRYADYESTLDAYQYAQSVSEASTYGAQLESKYDGVSRAATMRARAASVFLAVYVLNLLDTALFHTTSSSLGFQSEPPRLVINDNVWLNEGRLQMCFHIHI